MPASTGSTSTSTRRVSRRSSTPDTPCCPRRRGCSIPPAATGLGSVVVDPLDGSTNASLGLPWCNTALCLVVDGVPEVAMVSNLVTGDRYTRSAAAGAF